MTSAKLRNENQKTVIKTDDLNVNQPKETNREYAVPGQIKRDTAAIAGGKQVQYSILDNTGYLIAKCLFKSMLKSARSQGSTICSNRF